MTEAAQGSVYLEGMSVVPRTWVAQPVGKKKRKRQYGFTLHVNSCPYVQRSTKAMPAPAAAYPGTLPCQSCKPEGGDHVVAYADINGETGAKCSCGVSAIGPNYSSARQKVYREHYNTGETPRRTRPGPKAKPTLPDKLSFTYAIVRGGVRATCDRCGHSDVALTQGAARLRVYRNHLNRPAPCTPNQESP